MKPIAVFLVTFVTIALVGVAEAQTTAPAPVTSTAPAPVTPTPANPAPSTTPPAASTPAKPDATTPATTKKAPTAQQQKFSACSKDAKSKGLKGDDRKTYMSTCLKGDSSTATTKTDPAKAAAAAAKKAKRRGCSTQAKTQNLTGDDRKKFMTTCMKQP